MYRFLTNHIPFRHSNETSNQDAYECGFTPTNIIWRIKRTYSGDSQIVNAGLSEKTISRVSQIPCSI